MFDNALTLSIRWGLCPHYPAGKTSYRMPFAVVGSQRYLGCISLVDTPPHGGSFRAQQQEEVKEPFVAWMLGAFSNSKSVLFGVFGYMTKSIAG